jgi:hypothetical protein
MAKVRTSISQVVKHELDMGPLPLNRIPEKVWAVRKRDGKHVQINLKDHGVDENGKDKRFPRRHYELDFNYDPMFDPDLQPTPVPAQNAPEISGYKDEDIRQLTVHELKNLPEFKLMNRNRFRDQAHLVEELIAFRATLVEKPKKPKKKRETLGSSEQSQVVGS